MEESPWLEPRGDTAADAASFVPRARALADLLSAGEVPFAGIVSLSKTEEADVVILEVEVEVAQDRVNDIRPRERIAVEFRHDDRGMPEVFALRRDFPVVPHLIQRATTIPRNLCLFEDPWHEVKLRWTPAYFVSVLRGWFADTARGELHADDQPLEPLILGTGKRLIVPADLGDEDGPVRLDVFGSDPDEAWPVLLAVRPEQAQDLGPRSTLQAVATVVVGEAQEHGIIAHTPSTLADLHELLLPAGLNLVKQLIGCLDDWRADSQLLGRAPILITVLPKIRQRGAPVEATDVFAFIIDGTVGSLGEKLELWEIHEGHAAPLILRQDPRPESVTLQCLHPVSELSMGTAARVAGREPDLRCLVAIGEGAIGSQIVSNLIRMGFGSWTLVDHDLVLPHNLSRYALLGRAYGLPKAHCMAAALSSTITDSKVEPLFCDVLDPGSQAKQLAARLDEAEIVFDFSASTAVARHLSNDNSWKARRVSFFLNPSGRCLVMLAEDTSRSVPLDELEAQFYRLVARTDSLRAFYQEKPESLRYGGACSDTSMHLPQDRVALHSALAASAVQQLSDGAFISVWRLTEDLAIDRYRVDGATCRWFEDAGWYVGIDAELVTDLLAQRSEALPSETGGVLVGMVDAHRKRILLVDAVAAPPDSEKWPTAFIRGSVGLCKEVEQIQEWTGQAAHYVGEWHSHPLGKPLGMSNDDRCVLDFVAKHMRGDGLPGIVLIAGQSGVQCHIKTDGHG
ncbi:MAG: ThiF family adenylyltransferase [Chloroflexota bacterium]|nr:ThiF family adenylyltransferase [Chloroflexota bacterium]